MESKDEKYILKSKLEVAEKVKYRKVILIMPKAPFLVQSSPYLYYSSDLLVGSSSLGYGLLDL